MCISVYPIHISYQEVYVHDIYGSMLYTHHVQYIILRLRISSQGIRVYWQKKMQTHRDLQRDDKLLRPNMDLWPDMRVLGIVFADVPSGLRSGHLL